MLAVRMARGEPKALEIVEDAPIPEPGYGEVRIKVLAAGLCGTDRHIYNWDPGIQDMIKPPMIPGHEFCGEVDEVGSNNWMELKKGDFVTAEMHLTCGHCYQCRTGKGHICKQSLIYGNFHHRN